MNKLGKVAVALAMAFSVGAANAADLSEYVQTGLVAMWDGYRNQGADKPHDGTATNWFDTTGTHEFVLHRAFPADLGVRFSRYSSFGYAELSEESTKATFEKAENGTVEIVFWVHTRPDGCLLQSSAASGVAIGQKSGAVFVLGAKSGSAAMTPPPAFRLHTVSVAYDNGSVRGAGVDGGAVSTSGTSNWAGGTKTFLGATSASGGSSLQGSIYAIRVYDRHLTAEELEQNAIVDRERFNYRKLEASSSYQPVDYMAGVSVDKVIEVTDEKSVNAAHAEAVAYLAENEGATAAVKIPAGTFLLSEPIDMVAGESIIGAGRDKTFLDGSDAAVSDAEYAIRMNHADNLVRGLAVINISEITVQGVLPHAFIVKKGVLDSCRSAFNKGEYNGGGYGLLLQGGTATNCLIDHVICKQHLVYGVGVKIESGLLVDAEICECQSDCDRNTNGSGLYMEGANSRASHCRIHDCGNALPYFTASGTVQMNGGVLENSIVYGNQAGNNGNNATVPAGVLMKNGTMRYCTIANNTTFNDKDGYSGLQQTGGTVENCIFMSNGVANNGVVVTGGTFVNNLVDKEVTGRTGNPVADTAYFKDLGAHDFHIAARASLAVGKATPSADVTIDMDCVARDAEKPTIGAYEYVAPPAAFGATILVSQPKWREGDSPTVELAVDGVTDYSKLSVAWSVDEERVPSLDDQLNPAFEGLDVGRHTVGATASYGDKTVTTAVTNAFALLPTRVYVNKTGSKQFPYVTEATGTDSLLDAYGALWTSVSETTRVDIAAGTYRLAAGISANSPVVFAGAGRDETVLDGSSMAECPFTFSNDGNVLRDLTVCGGNGQRGINMSAGLVENCLVSNCCDRADGIGGGIHMTGGRVLACEITECYAVQMSGKGGGIAVMGRGAVVSNCYIHGNFATYGHNNQSVLGGGLYLQQGLVTQCRIVDNIDPYDRSRQFFGSTGSGVYVGDDSKGVLRNCLIARNSSAYATAVAFVGGTIENCTIVDNVTTVTNSPVVRVVRGMVPGNVYASLSLTNVVMWSNAMPTNSICSVAEEIVRTGETAANIGYCCWAEAEEGVDGNTAKDPKFRGGKNRGQGVISSYGSCFRTGMALDWMENATDLRGNPRLTDGNVDIGCYQVGFDPGLMLLVK